jgi:predicted TIM-barrel fold metal-dependent hydrolase
MVIDCHVHVCAFTPVRGFMSPRLLRSAPFRFMRWRFGLKGEDQTTECALEETLVETIAGTERLDAAVVLAFDAVYDREGRLDKANTHFFVSNQYVIELARRHKQIRFGASIHPYRKDAVAELERCMKAGAVLVKWLPLTQSFDPSDETCFPFYEALAHHSIPLLSHTGWEQSLPTINDAVADPMLLEAAAKRGVTIIAAHCGTRSMPWERDYVPQFVHMARTYEHFYGDTSALNLPTRSYAYETILGDELLRSKLVHGSDWPIIPIPPARQVGMAEAFDLMREPNWMRRDVRIKEKLGLDEAYWKRAGKVLGFD